MSWTRDVNIGHRGAWIRAKFQQKGEVVAGLLYKVAHRCAYTCSAYIRKTVTHVPFSLKRDGYFACRHKAKRALPRGECNLPRYVCIYLYV